MPSLLARSLFSEPSGRTHAVVMFLGSLCFVGLYVYAGVLGDSSSSGWLVAMAVGTALSGVAESLPGDRRRAAGTLRVTAILLLMGLLVAIVLSPPSIARRTAGGR
ncbi:hypothetical protein [Halorubrum amylolyticum]|uniref:hypothetical protein n=1 Tax=Halorubrum amylolyticum TaxID=2508724 RepID=UPI001008DB86|nr:hypothetical protein [Halorubrum amylolyticum]